MVLYYKGLEADVDILSPMDLGGLKSPEYLALNPQGKMPLLVTKEGPIYESDTIARYCMDRFAGKAPSLEGASLAERTLSNAIARHHDMYIQGIQGCMYKAVPPFGAFGSRRLALAELGKQLQVLEDLAASAKGGGPYIAGGQEPTLGDCTMFPTAVFLDFMLPKFDWTEEEIFGPKLRAWFGFMKGTEVGQRVYTEISSALQKWDANGRWDTIHLAGARDSKPPTLFDKILAGEIPSDRVYEDDLCLAFRDINPVAPSHVLVIPKHREGLTQLRQGTEDHKAILGHLLWAAGKVASEEGLEGYRVVINDGEQAAQSVFHLHVHVIGGRQMNWPPG